MKLINVCTGDRGPHGPPRPGPPTMVVSKMLADRISSEKFFHISPFQKRKRQKISMKTWNEIYKRVHWAKATPGPNEIRYFQKYWPTPCKALKV